MPDDCKQQHGRYVLSHHAFGQQIVSIPRLKNCMPRFEDDKVTCFSGWQMDISIFKL